MPATEKKAASQAYDLMVVLDATGSMTHYIRALNQSLPQIISMSALTDCFQRIGVVAYRDHCRSQITEWSGWCSPSGSYSGPGLVSQDAVMSMARKIRPQANEDMDEAVKTGLALAYSQMRTDATTIILLYSDAAPHFKRTGGPNCPREIAHLSAPTAYGGSGRLFVDWTSIATTLHSGDKKGIVFSFVEHGDAPDWTPYLYLSTRTDGFLFYLDRVDSATVSQLTLGTLLTWMKVGKTTNADEVIAQAMKYKDLSGIDEEKDENSIHLSRRFFSMSKGFRARSRAAESVEQNIDNTPVTVNSLPNVMDIRGPGVDDFAKRYMIDDDYKELAISQLRSIISSDVSVISLNPVFGTLWRTVCNDRQNEARNEIITLFGHEVDRIADTTEKDRMKKWLEESYNFAADIQDTIMSIPAAEQFPAVYLDPTLTFAESEEDGKPVNRFTRAELLEIGRSCDYRILRRLGKVLTQLTYVAKEEDLPAHVKNADASKVPRIPLALSLREHGHDFWKLLLHAVLPGTKMTNRPAAVLAALALRMGIAALRDVADQELLAFREYWNNLEVPETWNSGCLNLLLDADRDYENRVQAGTTIRDSADSAILNEGDRRLFKTLVDYKMLELNLKTTLQATVGWTPNKSKVALGPLVVCRHCKFPRSVTMMARGGICGLCDVAVSKKCGCGACNPSGKYEEMKRANVDKDHNERTQGCWVECGRRECRAQYVVYNPHHLYVPAKCFYCRHANGSSAMGQAPVVECLTCRNKIIWPQEYRPKNFDSSKFTCPACTSDLTTVVGVETTPEDLNLENGTRWMLKNDKRAIQEPLNGRSLFYTASHCDLANLIHKVSILPEAAKPLVLSGKLVQNEDELKSVLRSWIDSRRAEAGTCSLCFTDGRKSDLQKACGRSGCHQRICGSCKADWYGINRRGSIINIAALSCPFCRRHPSAKTISGFDLARLGNVRGAVAEAGAWIYAWCNGCGFAKPYMERVCAAGAPAEVKDWQCEECEEHEALATEEIIEEGEEPTMVKAGRIVIKNCPGCGVSTQKMSGCDHISCPCGVHWCYVCGEAAEEDSIYDHMSRVHGGWWMEEEEEEWE